MKHHVFLGKEVLIVFVGRPANCLEDRAAVTFANTRKYASWKLTVLQFLQGPASVILSSF